MRSFAAKTNPSLEVLADRKTTDFIIGSRQVKNWSGKQGLFRSRNGQVFEPKEADAHAAHQSGVTKSAKTPNDTGFKIDSPVFSSALIRG
jgi:hypothetical protein